MKVLKRIPFIILISAFISLIGVKILEYLAFEESNKVALEIISFIFNARTPFYFNHWLAYLFWATFLAILLTVFKQYRVWEAVISIGGNLILLVLVFLFIVTRM